MTSTSVDRRPAPRALSWAVTLLAPMAIVLTGVRLLLTPAFVQLEYRTPNFPADPFGFTRQERLFWSEIARRYLLNDRDISYLADLRFPDGSPVYNERELEHMVDVKNVVRAALRAWYASLAALLALGLWAWLSRWWDAYLEGLARGGWLTVLAVAAIVAFVLIGFGIFFVAFHQVFFDPGTWVFRYSDTLIRLFPERFWRDAFLAVGLVSLLGGFSLAFGLRRFSRRPQASSPARP